MKVDTEQKEISDKLQLHSGIFEHLSQYLAENLHRFHDIVLRIQGKVPNFK